MKRAALLLTLFVAAFSAACSGGGSSTLPPPPPLGFSNSSLKGQYAFSMSGQTLLDPNGTFIARIGTFVADGNGNITGGVELVSTPSGGLQPLQFTASNYQVNSDGRGAINLTNITGTISFSITMSSINGGYICQTDGNTGTSGSFTLQDTTAFTLSGINGPFVFDTSGLDPSGTPDSIVGQFTLNAGTVQAGGVFDENDGAVASGPQTIAANTYFLDATNGPTNGLGQLSFNGFVYDFIIVNSKKLFMIEVPGASSSLPITIGAATGQVAAPAANPAFNGNFAFLIAGTGANTPNEKAGRFTADGNGGLATSSIAVDDKRLGDSITQIPSGSLSAATYAIDTNFPGSGRGTVTFTDSSKGTFSFIFYMSSATQGVIQDNSAGLVGDGVIMAQTGGSQSALASNFAFNWSGISTNNTNGVSEEEDFVGQVKITSASSNNVSGAMDFSELNSNQGAFHNSALSGVLTINGDGTNSSGSRSGLTVTGTNPNGGPSTTFKFTVYVVNPTTIFVVSQDTDRVTGGTFTQQVTPP
jgi:hypothetical protein